MAVQGAGSSAEGEEADMPGPVSRLDEWRAFSVHLLTASGAFWAFLSIIAAAEHNWWKMFAWLGVALFVDAIDGPIARKANVRHILPNWSGDVLDQIIDYATYVIIPAFALYQSGLIEGTLAFIAAALIVITSAIYYADTRMKTEDYYFRGFPVAWNMVVFTFFATQPGSVTAFAFVAFCAVATFLPIKFVHPTRVKRLRGLTLAVTVVWAILSTIAIFYDFDAPRWATTGIVLTGIYLLCIGAVLQVADRFNEGSTKGR
jgi:phosphatidylcholine synthase